MKRHDAALPPAFSLLKSEFNDFLFAPIGDDGDPGPLTVLSAFSRESIDPWRQAARLAQMPKELAVRDLAATLTALPDRSRSTTEAQHVADRLIALLPRPPSLSARLSATARHILTKVSRTVSQRLR